MSTNRILSLSCAVALLMTACSKKQEPSPPAPPVTKAAAPPSAPTETGAPAPATTPAPKPAPPAAPPVTTKPASPPADQVNATPSAADQEVAGFKKQLDAHAKKLQALTMARDFMKDQQFSDLVDEMDDKVQMAQQAMEELSSATGAESTKLMSEVSATLQDIADLDKKAVARLQEIKDDV